MAKGEWTRTKRLIDAAVAILRAENPMTVRQLFYRLVSIAEVENCLHDYQRVSKAMTKARNDSRIRFSWIVDRSRSNYGGSGWSNLTEYAKWQFRGYRRDYWQDQNNYCEIWCEKDAVVGSIDEVTDKWGVTIRALRGFNSTTAVHHIADDFEDKNDEGKRIFVYYLGDHDPSGRAIEMDVANRVAEYNSGPFDIERLAIHKADIAKFKLPPLRVKMGDTRAKGFIRRHGQQAVELDALPPTELRRRIDQAIRAVVNNETWNRAQRIENAELETTKRIQAILNRELKKEISKLQGTSKR